MQRDVCQPDDVFIVFRQLGVVVLIIRVRLEMAMDSRLGVISVSLVHMLPRNHRGERDIRRQGQADDEPNRTRGHAHVIMATETTLRQTSLVYASRPCTMDARGALAQRWR